tara:strand:- start:1173 stop:2708 length:1536 start_codon:yes stop_codon:yes gene_type:complete
MPISKPNVTLNIIPAEQILSVADHRVLIVGQSLAAGTSVAGEILSDVDDATNAINAAFGTRSIIAEQIREFKKYNKISAIDALPLADAGGAVQATSDVVFAGTATASGTLEVTFGSEKRYKVQVNVLVGETAAEVATKTVAQYAFLTSAPFQVAASTVTVTATAENGGTHANDWTVMVTGNVAGITYSLVGWASGATDPSLTGVLDVLGNVRYNTVIWPAKYDIETIGDVLDARFNASNDVLDGVVIQGQNGTLTSLKAYVASLNSQSIAVIGDKTVSETLRKGTSLKEMPDVTAAQAAALRALRLTPNGNLTQFLTTTSSLDQFGGASLASLPYFNTSLPNMPIPLAADEFSFEDQEELKNNAISLIGANRAFNGTIFGEMVTTYLTDNAGNPDSSYKFLNTIDTASVVRETFFANYKNRFAQSRLTNGDLITGRDMANAESIKAFSLEVYKSLAKSALVQSGNVAERDFLDNLIVTLDLSTGTATVTAAPLLVSQLRAILGTIQINFGV